MLKTEVSTLSPVPCDSETRNDEIAVDVPLPEEPAEMSGENGQGWITEEAFFTASPGARQVRQRKEVKMKKIVTSRETRVPEEHGSRVADPAQEPSSQSVLSGRNGSKLESAGQIVRSTLVGARTWKPDDSKPSLAPCEGPTRR